MEDCEPRDTDFSTAGSAGAGADQPSSSQPAAYHPPGEPTDSQLVQRVRAGRADAVRAKNLLVDRYHVSVFKAAYRILGHRQDAEDATQDVFARVVAHLEEYHNGSFRAWVLKITTNICRDMIRKRVRRPVDALDLAVEQAATGGIYRNPQDVVFQQIDFDLLRQALASMPTEQYHILTLVETGELTNEAIAAICGISTSQLKDRLFRARRTLRNRYAKLAAEEFT